MEQPENENAGSPPQNPGEPNGLELDMPSSTLERHPEPIPADSNLESATVGEASGSWERSGRHPASAAILGLLGIGVVYFYGQSFLVTIAMLIGKAAHSLPTHRTGLSAQIIEALKNAKVPVRFSLLVSQYFLMLLPTIWLVRRWFTADVAGYIRFTAAPVSQILLAALAALLFFPFNVAIMEAFLRILHIPSLVPRISDTVFGAATPGEFFLLIVVIAVTPAICEEVMFRGFVQRTFENVIGWKSILLVGIIFGLFHYQPLSLLSLSGVGFLSGFVYFRSKSLLPAMGVHFTNNLLAISVLYFRRPADPVLVITRASSGLLLLCFLLEILVIWGFVHLTRPTEQPVE